MGIPGNGQCRSAGGQFGLQRSRYALNARACLGMAGVREIEKQRRGHLEVSANTGTGS